MSSGTVSTKPSDCGSSPSRITVIIPISGVTALMCPLSTRGRKARISTIRRPDSSMRRSTVTSSSGNKFRSSFESLFRKMRSCRVSLISTAFFSSPEASVSLRSPGKTSVITPRVSVDSVLTGFFGFSGRNMATHSISEKHIAPKAPSRSRFLRLAASTRAAIIAGSSSSSRWSTAVTLVRRSANTSWADW